MQPTESGQSSTDRSGLRPLSEHNVFQVKTATAAKLLATSQQFGYLLRLPEEVQAQAGRQHLLLRGSSLTCLQALESATGPNLKQALIENDGVSEFSNSFFTKTRLTTTDMAGANVVAEKLIMAGRDESWGHFHNFCNVHVISRSISRSLELFSKDVTGMINCSLALSIGSSMERFRRSLAHVLAQKIVVTPGSSSLEAHRHRDFVLDLFCTTGSKVALKQYLLKKLPNGNWQDREQVQVFVTPGVAYNESDIKEKVISGLLLVLSGKLLRTFPRHRWLGADMAIYEVGLCEAVHGLASQAFEHMMSVQRSSAPGPGEAGASTNAPESHLQPPDEPAGSILVPEATSNITDFDGPEGGDNAATGPAALLQHGVGELQTAQVLAAENERHRRLAAAWLKERPLANLMALRLCIGPLSDLIGRYVSQSGHRWETEERASLVSKLAGGDDKPRRYNLLEYVKLTAETHFFKQLESMQQDAVWAHIPREAWHMEFQSQLFRTLSRMGAAIEELLVEPTRRAPFLLLRLLTDDADASDHLVHTPDCCLDDFTRKHMGKYPEDELVSADSLAILESLCVCGSSETVGLEWGLSATSNQSKRPTLEFIGAQWLCQKHKQRQGATCAELQMSPSSRPPRVGGTSSSSQAGEVRKKQRGGGGTWRAFASMKARGQKGRPDFHVIAEEYALAKRLQTDELAQAHEVGAAATLRHQLQGTPGFGPTPRQVERKRKSMQDASLSLSLLLSTQLGGEAITNPLESDLKGQMSAECVFDVVPELHILRSSLHYSPHHKLLYADLIPNTYPELSMAVASFAKQNSRTLNLSASLRHDWTKRHETIGVAEATGQKNFKKPTLCCQYGLCLCTHTGKQVLSLRNQFLKHLKAWVSSQTSSEKTYLQDGWLVVLLKQQHSLAERPSWSACAMDLMHTDSAPDTEWTKSEEIWLHIAMQYFKPYRPTFHRLVFEQQEANGRITLRQTGHFLSEFRLWDSLNLESTWSMKLYCIVTGATPLAKLSPSKCWVEE